MATVTGATEHLEQLVRDMEDAGPGATESRTYCAIVAELEQRRANEKAPDAVQGVEGNETDPNHQEGEDPVFEDTVNGCRGVREETASTVERERIERGIQGCRAALERVERRWADFEERDREIARILDAANESHPASEAPYWFTDEPPVFDTVIGDEPVRGWERNFDEPSDPFGVRLYADDVLTPNGLVRSPVEVLVDTGPDGLTPEHAASLGSAISRAIEALVGGAQ